MSPEEETDLKAIERAIGKRLPRVTLPDFDYAAKPQERFEVPIAERIAAIRARKAEERARAKAKLERKAQAAAGGGPRPSAPRTGSGGGDSPYRDAGGSVGSKGPSGGGGSSRRRRRGPRKPGGSGQ